MPIACQYSHHPVYPIDLNAFLFKLESAIANIAGLKASERGTIPSESQRQTQRSIATCGMRKRLLSRLRLARGEMALFSAASLVRCMSAWLRMSRQTSWLRPHVRA
jgi:hypothetical protein